MIAAEFPSRSPTVELIWARAILSTVAHCQLRPGARGPPAPLRPRARQLPAPPRGSELCNPPETRRAAHCGRPLAGTAGCPIRTRCGLAGRAAKGDERGQAGRVRAPDARGAGHPFCPAVVHRRARVPEVGRGRARPSSEGAFAEGIGFDGSAVEGFARVYEADMIAAPDPSTFQLLPWRGEYRGRPDVLRHPDAGRQSPSYADPRWVLKRSLGPRRGARVHLLHPSRDRVLPAEGEARAGREAAADRLRRLLRPHPAQHRARLPPHASITDAGVDGHLGGVQPPRGRARAAGDRPALRRTRSPRPTTSCRSGWS